MAKRFLLCFHDLSVQNYEKVLPVLFDLKKIAGTFSLLVIPCVEGETYSRVEDFRRVLAELQGEGFELALHGFRHRMDPSLERSFFGKLANRFANDEAEFAGLNYRDSAKLLDAAVGAWQGLMGLQKPAAFVAPTWYGNCSLKSQVIEQGMVFESRISLVTPTKKRYNSMVTSFAGIPRTLEQTAIVGGDFIIASPISVPRIALHPVDFPRLEKSIYDLVKRSVDRCKVIKYADLL